MTGDIDGCWRSHAPELIAGADDGIRVIGLGLAGRRDEARAALAAMRESSRIPLFAAGWTTSAAWLDGAPAT